MNRLLIGLGVLLVVLVGAALVAPGFVDWNRYKAEIAAEAEKATGRRLTIDGDVALTLLPAPVLKASQVSLANVDGGSEPDMLALDSLDIRVSLLPLLSGRLQVNSVSLVRPRILLEVLADGRANWRLDPERSEPSEPAEAEASSDELPRSGESEAVSEPQSPAPAPAEPGPVDPTGDFAIQVDNFTIEDGLLIYRDAVSGTEERIEAIEARVVAESLNGPFEVEGEAALRGLRTTIDGAVGRLLEAGATTLNIDLGVPDAKAQAGFIGSLSRHPTSLAVRGKLKGEGENLAALLGVAWSRGEPLPAALANPFVLETTLQADQSEVKIDELRVGLGDTSVEGSGSLVLGPPIDARLKLMTSRLDLDALLAEAKPVATDVAPMPAPEPSGQAPDDSGAVVEAPAVGGGAGGDGAGGDGAAPAPAGADLPFRLPGDVEATVQLGVDALVYRQQVVRQVRFNAALSEGRFEINQALALLPGGSDISLTGALIDVAEGPRFDGHVEAASDNLRGVLDWLGVELSAVPADRLRKMSLTTRVTATPAQVSLADLDLRVDVSRLAGGVVAALRERPGLGIGLALDSLNLDAYLPRPDGAGKPGPASGSDEPASEAGQEQAQSESEQDEATPVEAAASGGLLDAFDANLNLRIGSLVYGGQTGRDITVEGTLQDGVLTFKQARVADLAGSALAYSGVLSGLDDQPALDGSLDLRIADPVKLARIAGIDSDLIGRLGAFNLVGNLKGSLDGLGINSKLALLGGRFGLAGTARPLANPPVFDLLLEAEHPDAVGLADALLGQTGLGGGLGGIDAKARLAGDAGNVTVSEIAGRLGPLGLSGSFGLELGAGGPEPRALDLAVHVKHGSLASLSRAIGGPAIGAELGGIDLTGRLTGDGRRFKLSGLTGVAGPLGVSGELDAGLDGGQPALGDFNLNLRLKHGSLAGLAAAAGAAGAVNPAFGGVDVGAHVFGNAGRVDLRDLRGSLGPVSLEGTASVDLSGAKPFVAADLNTGALSVSQLLAAAGAAGSGGAGGTGAGSLSPRWSAAPIDLSPLAAVNADLKLRSSVLSYDELRLHEADVSALLTDGRLDIRRLTGQVYGGTIDLVGQLDARSVPRADVTVTATNVDSGVLLVETADFERIRGPVTVNAKIAAQGRSETELVSSLSGQGDVAGTLTVSAKTEEAVGAALLNLLGKEIKEIRGIAGTANSLFQAFAGAPSRLTGSFLIDGGVIRTTDLRLEGRDAVASTHGSDSLPAWLIDSRTEVRRAGQGGDPFLTATLKGPLDEPNTKIGGEAFQRGPEPAEPPQGEGGGATPSEPQPQLQAPSAEDLLKGLLEKLD